VRPCIKGRGGGRKKCLLFYRGNPWVSAIKPKLVGGGGKGGPTQKQNQKWRVRRELGENRMSPGSSQNVKRGGLRTKYKGRVCKGGQAANKKGKEGNFTTDNQNRKGWVGVSNG